MDFNAITDPNFMGRVERHKSQNNNAHIGSGWGPVKELKASPSRRAWL